MALYEEVTAAQASLESLLTQKFADFERALQTASPGTDTIAVLRVEVDKFKEVTLAMIKLMRQQIAALSSSIDNIEMRHRRKYLLLAGVPETSNENVVDAVVTICRDQLKLPDVSSSSFSVCHRLGPAVAGRTRSILLRCSSGVLKDSIWRRKTALKGSSVVVSEFLTRQRQAVFLDARKRFGMRQVWTFDGTIFIKLPTGVLHRIVSAEQLNKLCKDHPIPTPVENVARDVVEGASGSGACPADTYSGPASSKVGSADSKTNSASSKKSAAVPKADPPVKKQVENVRSTRRIQKE